MKKKRNYVSPLWVMLQTDGEGGSEQLPVEQDMIIYIGGSQGTSGYDSMWRFEEGFDEADFVMIEANCDDFDLQDMDTNGDYIITKDEYKAWYDENAWW